MEEIRVGIAGYGRIGKIHLKNLVALQTVGHIAVCDPKNVEIPFPGISQYTRVAEMIDEFHPDVLFICSPTPSHIEMITSCCNKGIHVFCEKPVDLDIEKVQNIARLIEESNILVHVGFNRRFDPDFQRLQHMIANGQLGTIYQITITSRDPGLPSRDYLASSGGMMLDMTIHDFDMTHFLTGASVKEVYSVGQRRIDPTIEEFGDVDTATTTLLMDNDITCTIINSREAIYGYDQRIEVFGSKGIIKVDNQLMDKLSLATKDGNLQSPPEPFFLERYASSYQREVQDFIDNISHGRPASVTIEDAINATEIALMANESMAKNHVITR